MKVKLLAHTQNLEKTVAMAAKLCYSKVGVDGIAENLTEESTEKFLNMLASMGHESPFEHANFTFAIEGISRACTHQLVRHRLASYCISGNAIVQTETGEEITIEELYENKDTYKGKAELKCINEETKEIIYNTIKDVYQSGEKKMCALEVEGGKKVYATLDHMFLTENGWKRLEDVKIIKERVYIEKAKGDTHATLVEIVGAELKPIEMTYDIEMEAPHHNFIADGFVVHNSQQSQRYVKLEQFEYIVPKAIENIPKAKELFIKAMKEDQKTYNELTEILFDGYLKENIEKGMEEKKAKSNAEKRAIEDARYVFPNACETKIVVTMNARSLYNFFNHRCCQRAQTEIRELATEMLRQVKQVAPTIFKNMGPNCVSGPCPEGSMTCGKAKEMKEFFLNL